MYKNQKEEIILCNVDIIPKYDKRTPIILISFNNRKLTIKTFFFQFSDLLDNQHK